ncbi:MAG: hypothetical protein LC797_23100 [Chloroflexi bacterium]|nr:hypothetical protein [Chloroflexota bacterium]
MDSPVQTAASLQPRYRRLLTFGDVLDESMLLFHREDGYSRELKVKAA